MRFIAPILFAALACLTSGCLSFKPKEDTTRFFVLAAAGVDSPDKTNAVIELSSVRVYLPDYLNRRALAIRKGSNEIVFYEAIQWAEPLDRGIARILTQIMRPHGTQHEVEVTVRRFDVTLAGEVTLEADWLQTPKGKLHTGRFTAQGPAPASDPAGTIETMSRTVELLARPIAEAEGVSFAPEEKASFR